VFRETNRFSDTDRGALMDGAPEYQAILPIRPAHGR
jgi:hypothetical protein